MIHVLMNGDQRELERETALVEFVTASGLDGRRIAIAHNGLVLYREDWAKITLRDGDRLEIVRMIGGGSAGR